MSAPTGVLLIDKPRGPTSHDVVSRVRRVFSTKRVGHAGTLDPAATGVLVVLLGEATKLAPYLTAADKSYLATVRLGQATDTLDAEGQIVEQGPVSLSVTAELQRFADAGELGPALRAALAGELARSEQVPPSFSAIHVDGQRSHELSRRGQAPQLPARPVKVLSIELCTAAADPPTLEAQLTVSKGYYVRSLARDLGAALGCPAHLTALRRQSSGVFELSHCVALEGLTRDHGLLSCSEAAKRVMPCRVLDDQEVTDARYGRSLVAREEEPEQPIALLAPDGLELVAIASRKEQCLRIDRGFVPGGQTGS